MEWLNLLLGILGILVLLAAVGGESYYLYRYLSKPGSCGYYPFSPGTNRMETDQYTQIGYIQCSGGGPFWSQQSITIQNQSPTTYYFGPVPGHTDLVSIDPKKGLTYNPRGVLPTVYAVSGNTQQPILDVSTK